MDSVKNSNLFQEIDSLVPAFFWTCIPDTDMQDEHASSVWRYWSLLLPMWWCSSLSHLLFYRHIKHMAAICVKFRDFPPWPLYICFGESPQCCLFLALCFYNKAGSFRRAVWAWIQHKVCTHIKPLRLTFILLVNAFIVQCIQAAHSTLKSPSKLMHLYEGTCHQELIMWSLDAGSTLVHWTQISDCIKQL